MVPSFSALLLLEELARFSPGAIVEAMRAVGGAWIRSLNVQGGEGEQHPPSQYPGMVSGWGHYKLICPWLLIAEEPVHFHFGHPFYHHPDPGRFQVMPGVTEFHWQHHVHVNAVFPLHKQLSEVGLHVGAPVSYLTPLEDIDVEIRAECVSQDEYDRLDDMTQLSFHHHKLARTIGS
ncbi:MAG: hypothetical protein O9306_16480 [Beijerinckiaceae bacterium]|jgi:hypothetical protein|nr:hypothetical protein [Beijerinckiaceae bacterium]